MREPGYREGHRRRGGSGANGAAGDGPERLGAVALRQSARWSESSSAMGSKRNVLRRGLSEGKAPRETCERRVPSLGGMRVLVWVDSQVLSEGAGWDVSEPAFV